MILNKPKIGGPIMISIWDVEKKSEPAADTGTVDILAQNIFIELLAMTDPINTAGGVIYVGNFLFDHSAGSYNMTANTCTAQWYPSKTHPDSLWLGDLSYLPKGGKMITWFFKIEGKKVVLDHVWNGENRTVVLPDLVFLLKDTQTLPKEAELSFFYDRILAEVPYVEKNDGCIKFKNKQLSVEAHCEDRKGTVTVSWWCLEDGNIIFNYDAQISSIQTDVTPFAVQVFYGDQLIGDFFTNVAYGNTGATMIKFKKE